VSLHNLADRFTNPDDVLFAKWVNLTSHCDGRNIRHVHAFCIDNLTHIFDKYFLSHVCNGIRRVLLTIKMLDGIFFFRTFFSPIQTD
jgi:hypothetical protein